MSAKTHPGAIPEDPRWQVLRDIFGLDGSHDGIWHGVVTPDQIITHVRYVADDRTRLLKLATDRASHPDQPEAPDEFGQTGWDAGWNAGYRDGYNEAHTRYALVRPDQPEAPGAEAVAKALYESDNPDVTWDEWLSYAAGKRSLAKVEEECRRRAKAVLAAFPLPSSDRIRQETAEERIREDAAEDERDRLFALIDGDGFANSGARNWFREQGAMLPADRAAKRTEGGQ